ncbi:Aste57867_9099 [Aphanomyces stellatus]|uniref:Aste57867_9099 protein n=1 Tax=Aphanomyces stellatus TaxID=120398 RepID=A0A485KM60_9STRA|nr:hypothetical protein As57867_009063 [Aphanomyces stellatus]VFT85983.1 Aste57867_9099 [Aphanomyces stellatus]
MCGRACCVLQPREVCEATKTAQDDFVQQERYVPHFNVSPGMYTPIQYRDKSSKRMMIRPMKWGLIPSYIKPDEKVNHFMRFNARSESMTETPAYRQLVDQKRCVVLLNGFYEWHKLGKTDKQPYFIHIADDRVMRIAGLFDVWEDTSGERIYTYSIITTASPTKMSWIHNRMPMILNEVEATQWLADGKFASVATPLVHPYAHGDMAFYPVTKQCQPTFDSEACLIQVDVHVAGKITSFYKQNPTKDEQADDSVSTKDEDTVSIKSDTALSGKTHDWWTNVQGQEDDRPTIKDEHDATMSWPCAACTYVNTRMASACVMCHAARVDATPPMPSALVASSASSHESAGPSAQHPTTHAAPSPWTCPACTFEHAMPESVMSCVMCGHERHEAHGWTCDACTFVNESPSICGMCYAFRKRKGAVSVGDTLSPATSKKRKPSPQKPITSFFK